MRKTSLFVILFIGCLQQSFAQGNNNVPEPVSEKKEKKIDHYVGVQLNGLIRQVFNFNNNNTTTSVNPYLLTYNLNFRKSLWGIRLGVGYNYVSNNSDDGITTTNTKINDMQLRVGGEKAFKLSQRWTTGVGLDFVSKLNDDNTTNTIHSFDTTTTATKSKGTGMGGGPMAWLRYSITPRILIGTEASFYYMATSEKNVVTVTNRTFNSGSGSIITTTETTTKPKGSQGTFSSPIVFFLSIKF